MWHGLEAYVPRKDFVVRIQALIAWIIALTLGVSGAAAAQDTNTTPARQQFQAIHGPGSIDQELDRLTRDLELTSEQQEQVKLLLQVHHDKIQELFDSDSTMPRQALVPQIHAISNDTHHQIHALLDDHQKELESQMLSREQNGQESRRAIPKPSQSSPQ